MLSGQLQDEMCDPHSEKTKLAKRVFFLALLAPCILPAEISTIFFGGVFLLWLVTSGLVIERVFLLLIAPLLLMLFVGLLGANSHELYDVGKDVWYLAKAILAIGVGYFLTEHIGSLRAVCR